MPSRSSVLEVFLPEGALEWFDVVKWKSDEEEIHIILEEKNIPPLSSEDQNKNVLSKGFFDITIRDFPIRGRAAILTFRRRRWRIEGQKRYLKRDIKLCAQGTQLEKEFAAFLKEDGGRGTMLAGFYSKVSAPPNKRI